MGSLLNATVLACEAHCGDGRMGWLRWVHAKGRGEGALFLLEGTVIRCLLAQPAGCFVASAANAAAVMLKSRRHANFLVFKKKSLA